MRKVRLHATPITEETFKRQKWKKHLSENFDLRNAFKTNAWMQISHLSVDESKEQYIEIINSLLQK